jgi:hypothetical protein
VRHIHLRLYDEESTTITAHPTPASEEIRGALFVGAPATRLRGIDGNLTVYGRITVKRTAAVTEIRLGSADELIVSSAPIQHIGAAPATEHIIPPEPFDNIVASAPLDDVAARRARDQVRARRAYNGGGKSMARNGV